MKKALYVILCLVCAFAACATPVAAILVARLIDVDGFAEGVAMVISCVCFMVLLGLIAFSAGEVADTMKN